MSIIFCKHPAWQCISFSLGVQFPLPPSQVHALAPPSARVCVWQEASRHRGNTAALSAFFPPLTLCCSSVKCEKSAPLWGQRRHYLNISCTWKCMLRNCKLFNVAFWNTQRESERSLVESVSLARDAQCIQHTHVQKYVRSITLSCPYTFHSAQKEKLQAAKKPANDCPPASLRSLCIQMALYGFCVRVCE